MQTVRCLWSIVTEIGRRRQIWDGLSKIKILMKIGSQRDMVKLIAEFLQIFAANVPKHSYS
jgi:hypothetical protein